MSLLFPRFPDDDPGGVEKIVRAELAGWKLRPRTIRAGTRVDEDGACARAPSRFHVPERIANQKVSASAIPKSSAARTIMPGSGFRHKQPSDVWWGQ